MGEIHTYELEKCIEKYKLATIKKKTLNFCLLGQLSEENRWVIMSKLIPWSEYEWEYAEHFSPEMGAPAKSFRMALGALIIKEKLVWERPRNRGANPRESVLEDILLVRRVTVARLHLMRQ